MAGNVLFNARTEFSGQNELHAGRYENRALQVRLTDGLTKFLGGTFVQETGSELFVDGLATVRFAELEVRGSAFMGTSDNRPTVSVQSLSVKDGGAVFLEAKSQLVTRGGPITVEQGGRFFTAADAVLAGKLVNEGEIPLRNSALLFGDFV